VANYTYQHVLVLIGENMKDAFGYNYWNEEARGWFEMAQDAKRRGFLNLAQCFTNIGNQYLNKAEGCK
jgi:hypothetical protein